MNADKARAAGVAFARKLAEKVHVINPASHVHIASCRCIHAAPLTLFQKLACQKAFKKAAAEEFHRLTGVQI